MKTARLALATSLGIVSGIASPPSARAQVTHLVSVAADGTQSDQQCLSAAISSDGRVVVFWSTTRLLVPGTQTTHRHCFVKDVETGAIELASVDSQGVEANDDVLDIRSAGSCDFVVFTSRATNLVEDDTNGVSDCFLRDRTTGVTERVSVGAGGVQGNAESFRPVVSADGRYVLFSTVASNFAPEDDNGTTDVYLRDRLLDTTTLVSVATDGTSGSGYSLASDLTPDGGRALFESNANDLVAGKGGNRQVYLRDLATGTTEIASLTWDGQIAGDCYDARCSSDGRKVVFTSQSSSLVPHDPFVGYDVFLRDLDADTIEVASVGTDGQASNGDSEYGAISGDGRFVAFESISKSFDPTDTNDGVDVFVRDRRRDLTYRITLSTTGQQSRKGGGNPLVSADGHAFLFHGGDELDPVDQNLVIDQFVHRLAPTDARRSHYGAGFPGNLGLPALDVDADPVLGRPIDLSFTNSSGVWTVGFLVVGAAPTSVRGGWGGDLLVLPTLFLPIPLPPTGYVLPVTVPNDAILWEQSAWLQAIEVDPFAPKGLSSTDGLELDFGD